MPKGVRFLHISPNNLGRHIQYKNAVLLIAQFADLIKSLHKRQNSIVHEENRVECFGLNDFEALFVACNNQTSEISADKIERIGVTKNFQVLPCRLMIIEPRIKQLYTENDELKTLSQATFHSETAYLKHMSKEFYQLAMPLWDDCGNDEEELKFNEQEQMVRRLYGRETIKLGPDPH